MVGKPRSFWEGLFSGSMLVSGRVLCTRTYGCSTVKSVILEEMMSDLNYDQVNSWYGIERYIHIGYMFV